MAHSHHRRRPTSLSLFAAEQNLDIERHAYCLCLHVRPATIFIALFNLGSSMTCGFLLMYIAMNGASNGGLSSSTYFQKIAGRSDDMNIYSGVSILMCFFLSLVSAMLLYGVIKAKPSYVLPFFCIQFIEYLHTILQFIGAIYAHPMSTLYMPRTRDSYGVDSIGNSAADPVFPLNSQKVYNGNHFQAKEYTSSLLIMTLLLIFKTYFLSVVWKCYRYLHLREFILPVTLSEARNHIPFDESMMRSVMVGGQAPPPKYEDAIKYPSIQPPSYDAALQQEQQGILQPDTETNNELITPPNTVNTVNDTDTNVVTQDMNNNPVVLPAIDPGTTSSQQNNKPCSP